MTNDFNVSNVHPKVSSLAVVAVLGKAANTANRIYLLRRTLKFILGVLTGKWEVHMSWVTACLKARRPVSEEDHEVTEDSAGGRGGPILGRLQAGSVQLLKGWEVSCFRIWKSTGS